MFNTFYILIGVAVILLGLIIWLALLQMRLKKIFKGKNARDLEEVMASIQKEIGALDQSRKEIEKYLETAERRLRQSIQKVGVVRFNPFEGVGSNQSFAVALLNEKGDGVVISSLYSREGVRTYAKDIKNYHSEYSLSDEEKEAINQAKHEA